jgi:hypothetical protein
MAGTKRKKCQTDRDIEVLYLSSNMLMSLAVKEYKLMDMDEARAYRVNELRREVIEHELKTGAVRPYEYRPRR